jgi:hypothetical protein
MLFEDPLMISLGIAQLDVSFVELLTLLILDLCDTLIKGFQAV